MGLTTSLTVAWLDGVIDDRLAVVAAMTRLGWDPVDGGSEAVSSNRLTRRQVRFWRRGAWLLMEEDVGFEPGQLGLAIDAERAYSVDVFGSDDAMIARHSGGESAWLLVGINAPPGVGRLHATALPAFAGDVDGVSAGDLRRLISRSDVPVEDACAALFEALNVPFEFAVPGAAVLAFSDGTEVAVSEPRQSGFEIASMSWSGPIAGVSGETFETEFHLVNWTLTGDLPEGVLVRSTGSGIEDGVVHLEAIRYATGRPDDRWWTVEDHRADLIDGEAWLPIDEIVDGEARQAAGRPRPNSVQVFAGLEGRFGEPGFGGLELVIDGTSGWSQSARVNVGVIPMECAPTRRSAPPTDGMGAGLLPFGGDDWVVVGAYVDSLDVLPSAVELFRLWVSLVDLGPDASIELAGVTGVRSLRSSIIGGSSRRWARAVEGLSSSDFVIGHTGNWDDDEIPRFDVYAPRRAEAGRIHFSVPNQGGVLDTLVRTLDVITAAPEIRQLAATVCGLPGRHCQMEQLYRTAIRGHMREAEPPFDYIVEPGDLLYIDVALADQLTPGALAGAYQRTDLEHCVRLDSNGARLAAREAALGSLLQ